MSQGEVIAIDGKTVRHSYERAKGKGAIVMVSAWASANRLVLGQRKVDEKSNEITAIPHLLQMLAIEGCIVTIDAMGTQKEIASAIIDQGADYVLALKGNQGSLLEDVQWLFEQAKATQFQHVPHDFAQTIDKGHGRIEIRRCWTLSELEYLVQKPQWKGLQTIVMLQSERRINGHLSTETRYYISSLATLVWTKFDLAFAPGYFEHSSKGSWKGHCSKDYPCPDGHRKNYWRFWEVLDRTELQPNSQ